MAKEKDDILVLRGKVVDASQGARFRVTLENGHTLNAIISGRIRKNNIQILLDDVVDVEMSLYDLTIGRITYRH